MYSITSAYDFSLNCSRQKFLALHLLKMDEDDVGRGWHHSVVLFQEGIGPSNWNFWIPSEVQRTKWNDCSSIHTTRIVKYK